MGPDIGRLPTKLGVLTGLTYPGRKYLGGDNQLVVLKPLLNYTSLFSCLHWSRSPKLQEGKYSGSRNHYE